MRGAYFIIILCCTQEMEYDAGIDSTYKDMCDLR